MGSIKIWEIDFADRETIYEDSLKRKWKSDGYTLRSAKNFTIEESLSLSGILNKLEFRIIEQDINWEKVENNAEVLVRDHPNDPWDRRHFARYENGRVHAWVDGKTSYTTRATKDWFYARLANK